VFTRSGGVWTQQGNKLVGTGAVGAAEQGFSVALSSDGPTTAILGGPTDNSAIGAAWVFVQPNRLTATPTSGPAPLAVLFQTQAHKVDTFTVDFGDGTTSGPMLWHARPIRCSQNGPCFPGFATTSHAYTSPGNYTATLLDTANASVGAATIIVTTGPSVSRWKRIDR
jgi:PKD repeat protein